MKAGQFSPKQDTRDSFEMLFSKHLNFLFDEFAFKIISVKKDNYGCVISCQNNTTALQAALSPLDGQIIISVYRIVDGQIPKYPLFFDRNADFLVFSLDTLSKLKTGQFIRQEQKDLFDAKGIERIVKEYADLLKRYGTDFLHGNFGILPELKEVVARQAKELEHER
jgi:hypothetical protein